MLPLLDPPGWDGIPEHVRAELRCGPGNGFAERIVPDKLRLGWPFYAPLLLTPACGRHDGEYRWLAPPSRIGKEKADRRFRRNLWRLAYNAGGPRWLRRYRYSMGHKYYVFVRDCGGIAFWDNKVRGMKGDNLYRDMDSH